LNEKSKILSETGHSASIAKNIYKPIAKYRQALSWEKPFKPIIN
jgi:hypothetical protein